MAYTFRTVHQRRFAVNHRQNITFRAGGYARAAADAVQGVDVRMHRYSGMMTGQLQPVEPVTRFVLPPPDFPIVWKDRGTNQHYGYQSRHYRFDCHKASSGPFKSGN
jgi:hypothetical protein